MKTTDPSRMPSEERMAELGALLAAGIQRLLARGIKAATGDRIGQEHLDVDAQAEAPCGPTRETTA